MGLQKYRADKAGEPLKDGSIPYYTLWIGGPTLALIRGCATPYGPRTVYVRGEPDSFTSIPAACKVKDKNVRGWLTFEDGSYKFNVVSDELKLAV